MGRRRRFEKETVSQFLNRELPAGRRRDADFVKSAIENAGLRFDRYYERRDEWWRFSKRANSLKDISGLSGRLIEKLRAVDIMTGEEIDSRIGPEKKEHLTGLLAMLKGHASEMLQHTQSKGKPTDLAKEKWILELADIFENAFRQPPSVSGSDLSEDPWRGKFYRLLELARPSRFAQSSGLSLKHVRDLLKERASKRSPISLEDARKMARERSRDESY